MLEFEIASDCFVVFFYSERPCRDNGTVVDREGEKDKMLCKLDRSHAATF